MANTNPVKELENAIGKLRAERATLMARVSEIDASFGRLGIAVAPAGAAPAKVGKRRGPKPKAAKAAKAGKPGRKKGGRGKFAISGDESILAFVKSAGRPNAAEVNVHWHKEGRGGTANTPISKLLKAGKLKRIDVEGERGARYEIA